MLKCITGFLFACLFLDTLFLEARIWTTRDGTKSQGELIEVTDDRIGLRINGRDYHFSINRFSDQDQAYVRQWAKVSRCPVCLRGLSGKTKRTSADEFHASCFRCMVCEKGFVGGERFQRDPWGGMAHLSHGKSLESCGSCSKFFVRNKANPRQFFDDGRVSCETCIQDGVLDQALLEQVLQRIKPVMRELGLAEPKGSLALHMVDRNLLNREALKINARGNLRGLTLTKYKVVGRGSRTSATFDHKIFVLYGLPHVECVSVLAHEWAHVWLNERFIDASPPVIEGFCNLVSEHALDREKSKLSSVIRENMLKSDSPVYGAGYRQMKQRLAQIGWAVLLKEMKAKSSPPQS
tara:strand:- start:288 stop:1340 length:1053 start_codon:yes stop_codon:yes gene_type:complete